METIETGQPEFPSSLTPAQERAITTALRPSDAAIGARSGGPVEKDGGISEAPVGASELHFFPSEAEAQAAADAVEPLVGSLDDSVFNGVRVLGPVLVLHYSYGMGDRPGGVGIEADIGPLEDCLRQEGYLPAS